MVQLTERQSRLPNGKRWATVFADTFDSVPGLDALPVETFVLLVAMDARSVSNDVLLAGSRRLLAAGARAVCAWGSDCHRVEECFDFAAAEVGLNRDDAVIMTTSHADEPLKEAVWYAVVPAFVDDDYFDPNAGLVAVAVGRQDWHHEIHEYLSAGAPGE